MTYLLRSPITLGLTLGTTTTLFLRQRPSSPSQLLYCDAPSTSSSITQQASKSLQSSSTKNSSQIYRQISSGSIIGLLAGLAVGTFSRTLTFLFGLVVLGVQYAASKGIHVVPYKRIQRYLKGVNVKRALEENIAFKVSFGLTFALAAFVPL